MSRKSWGTVLVIAGLILAVLSALADVIGIGLLPDIFGVGQIIGLIVGIALFFFGLYLLSADGQPETAQAPPMQVATQPAAPATPDELTRIEGIGPRIQTLLNETGISTFQAIADTTADHLTGVLQAADFSAPFDATSWPEQAALAAQGKWDELQLLQDKLVGGRDS